MKVKSLEIDKLVTDRLILIPFTIQICRNLLNDDYSDLEILNLKKGESWPDNDVIETLPKIINNLSKVETPTGYESWMIIKKETLEIIGDLGFKGFNYNEGNIDIGYGIIKEERRKGYAEEAVKEIIKWAFSNKIVREITANCLTENVNSINLLTKFNFTELRTVNGMKYWNLVNKNFKKN
ncbi:GNAT family N-acetyltransferase [Flavobacterium columnare]|uniref:GNAT family N-acetyltransferase n=1 Tax=Flavobacterium columnare TaxID=996 RepID=UPI002D20D0B4|nr:GNAT family N-acetyltransferase [Flavobacterium columnare]MEB3800743.1 GNAT family N-acetyltransferase [Flavobacterium columnare]